MNPSYYTVGSSSPYAGKSLNQINAGGYQGIGFNPQDFAKYLGVGADTPLTAGQQLSYSGGQQGDTDMINKILTQQSQGDRQMQAIQPAVDTLQASKAPLAQRYSDLINNIKGQQNIASNRQTTTTNNELGRRGITGGGLYDQSMTDALNPVNQFYTSQIQDTSNQGNLAQNSVDQAIAQLQAGAGNAGITNAMQLLGMNQQNSIAQQQLALASQQQGFAQKYIPIPGYGIYDLQNKNLLGGLSQSGLSPSGNQVLGVY